MHISIYNMTVLFGKHVYCSTTMNYCQITIGELVISVSSGIFIQHLNLFKHNGQIFLLH